MQDPNILKDDMVMGHKFSPDHKINSQKTHKMGFHASHLFHNHESSASDNLGLIF